MRRLLALYNIFTISTTLVYMMQNVEYHANAYIQWFWRVRDFSKVMQRRTLDLTKVAQLLRWTLIGGMASEFTVGILLIVFGVTTQNNILLGIGVGFIVLYPWIWAHLVLAPLMLGRYLIIRPQEAKLAEDATAVFGTHKGKRIAIVGSYGKTSMKEMLATVLGASLDVVATPGNMNVLSSHARFAKTLHGDEDVVIVEFGEGKPGDVASFSKVVQPTHAVITGLAPAHLDQYKTLEAAGSDIFSVTQFVSPEHIYVNVESNVIRDFMTEGLIEYNRDGVLGWRVESAKTDIYGTSFDLVRAGQTLKLRSSLLGLHQVGPLAVVAAIGLEFGLTPQQVEEGIAATRPFEHRMQPYQLAGAWIIDDTYNGNIEGVRAGTKLLADLEAKRKIYVTPGLVDQGDEVESIHGHMGELIAAANPNLVVLMQNSVTGYIQAGLVAAGYEGEVLVQADPLDFYTHLDHFVAEGDVVLMQNDWTDNYA